MNNKCPYKTYLILNDRYVNTWIYLIFNTQMFRYCMQTRLLNTNATEKAKTTHRFIPSRTFSGFTPASVGKCVTRKQRERMNVTVCAAALAFLALLSPGFVLFSRRSRSVWQRPRKARVSGKPSVVGTGRSARAGRDRGFKLTSLYGRARSRDLSYDAVGMLWKCTIYISVQYSYSNNIIVY